MKKQIGGGGGGSWGALVYEMFMSSFDPCILI